MNFGLALAKPGESNLGLAARLWQANLGAWRFDSMTINHRIDQEITQNHCDEFRKVSVETNGLAAIKEFERYHLPNQPRANLPANLKMIRDVRQCFVCAQSRYHSLYFNTPWIEKCPIHDSPLQKICPTCGKKWPSADDVHKRTCETCGIRRKSGSPTKLDLFGSDEFDLIKELDVFFSHTINVGVTDSIHLRHLSSLHANKFAKTHLYPSVLAAHFSQKGMKLTIPEAIEPKVQSCQHKRFKFKPALDWNGYISDEKIKKMSRIRQKAVQSVLQELQSLADHPLGSCEQDQNNGHFECIQCECHNQISLAFFNHVSRMQPVAYYYLPGIGKERFIDPGLFQVVHDNQSERIFKIPDQIQWLLYELDIKSCIKRLIFQLHYLNSSKCISSSETNPIKEETLLGGHPPYTNYYYFVIEGEYCHLYYPNEYNEIRFFEFENWISIMSSF